METVAVADTEKIMDSLRQVLEIYEDMDLWRCRTRRLYRVHRITRGDLAERLGVHHNTVQRFDAGVTEPNPKFLLRLLEFESKMRDDEATWPEDDPRRIRMKRLGYDDMDDRDFRDPRWVSGDEPLPPVTESSADDVIKRSAKLPKREFALT